MSPHNFPNSICCWNRCCHHSLLIAHPVGDGNALELRSEGTALMDCGGDYRALEALRSASARGMSEFLLTHLHCDHYSGVTSQTMGTKLSFDVKEIFFSALPLIGNQELTREFALALFTLNHILGGKSGIPEQDLIEKFQELNPKGTRPSHRFLSKGDVFDLAGVSFEVLWPPKNADESIVNSARKAIKLFNNAMNSEPKLKESYENMKEIVARSKPQLLEGFEGVVDFPGVSQEAISERTILSYRPKPTSSKKDKCGKDCLCSDVDNVFNTTVHQDRFDKPSKMSREFKEANDSIRGVANRLCLAFHSGDRFIHLGDLERAELNKVAISIGQNSRFFAMIAAHHGTHFSKNMRSLGVENLIVSNGIKLMKKFDNNYNHIAGVIQQTGKLGHCYLCF